MSGITPPRELVLASAGSGKTFRISSRLIGLLTIGVPPEQILASSFTRKAAGQILDRTLARMAAAAIDPVEARELGRHATLDPRAPAPTDTAAWAEVLECTVRSLHRLDVGTLDAFLVRAARTFESEIGLPAGWGIADMPGEEKVLVRALARILDSADRDGMIRILRLWSNGGPHRSVHDRLLKSMRALLEIDAALEPGAVDPWGAFRRAGVARHATAAEREALASYLQGQPLPLKKKGNEEDGRWRIPVDKLAVSIRAGDWESVLGSTLIVNSQSPDPAYYGVPYPLDLRLACEEAVEMGKRGFRAVCADRVEALGEVTTLFRDTYRALQREAGAFTFSDITRLVAAGDPLGGRNDLYYRLDGQIRHILLDEFQDTSRPQWDAIEPLMDEVLSDDGRAAVVVADPKQSIYAWRGAEPDLVHAVGDRYSLVNDHLAVSYRSSQVVLDFVNLVFSDTFANPILSDDGVRADVASAWSDDFREHTAHKDLSGHVSLEVGPEDEDDAPRNAGVCAYAAARVADLRGAAPGFSIGVLTRTNAAVARLYLELRNLGIPVSQEGGNPLTDSAACEAVLALLRLADHPGDSIAAYHIAHSPLGRILRFPPAHDDREAVARFAARVRARLIEDGYGAMIGDVAAMLAPSCDRREARRLSQLAEFGHRYDDSGATLRPADFIRLVEATRVEDPAATDVRVMTVHQAKGLEFDIVVLPELGGRIERKSDEEPRLLTRRPTRTGRPDQVMPSVNAKVRQYFPELRDAHDQRQAAAWRDALSSIYVALTRARYATILVATESALRAGPASATPAAVIANAIGPSLGAVDRPGGIAFSMGSANWHLHPDAAPESKRGGTPAPSPPVRLVVDSAGRALRRQSPSDLHGDGRVDVRNLLRIDTAAAMERGTLIHAWFELVEWVDDGVPDDEELIRLARRVAPHLPTATVEKSVDDFREWMMTGAIRSVLRRSRYPDGAEVQCEVPFVERRDGALMEGVIDRLVLVREGGRPVSAEIIDYKTDRLDDHEIPARAEHYRPQLEAYARAVSAMYGIPVDRCGATLVFLDPKRVEALAPLPPTPPVS